MAQPYTPGEEDFDADEIIKRATARRGDIFPEFQIFIRSIPKAYALNQRCAGYVHQYAELGTADQVLSLPMRELIATTQLCAKGDDRFAPNHVRRMWRLGVTNRVMFEAALAMAMASGWSTIGHVALAVQTAGDPAYKDGAVPEGGEPKTLTPFAELAQGRVRVRDCDEHLLDDPDWKEIAQIDPELAARFGKLADYAQLADGATSEDLLGPGPRALITIAGLCARGFTELAARHIRRAYAYAMTRKQVFEAISCVLPMGGGAALQIGMQAIRLAESQ